MKNLKWKISYFAHSLPVFNLLANWTGVLKNHSSSTQITQVTFNLIKMKIFTQLNGLNMNISRQEINSKWNNYSIYS